jgi:hypothetical protein
MQEIKVTEVKSEVSKKCETKGNKRKRGRSVLGDLLSTYSLITIDQLLMSMETFQKYFYQKFLQNCAPTQIKRVLE